ncbi:MAG: twin-arginine translocase subunit TatC [Spirochaetes bacterium]|nr:twin-arginine translocase subunit TatC [Spirochaetota bacterium]
MKRDDDKKVSVKKKSVPKKTARKNVKSDKHASPRKAAKTGAARKDIVRKDIVRTDHSKSPDNSTSINSTHENSITYKGLISTAGLIGYLDKFRSKIIVTVILFVILIFVAFSFSDIMLDYINKPFLATGNKLNIFTLMGGFMLRFKISAAASFFVLIPLIIYQIWSVFSSSMPKSSKLLSVITIAIAVLLFYGGAAFTFFFLLPQAIDILTGFISAYFKTTIGADNYLGFIIFFSLAMGVFFETPVIVFVLTRMGIITPAMLSNKRKYAVVIIWIIAAVITPQVDPLSQALVAIPLMIIYEISIIISKLVVRRNEKIEADKIYGKIF